MAEGRQGQAEPGPHDRLRSAFGIQVCPGEQLVVGAAIVAIAKLDSVGGEECNLNLNCASCRFCVMYRGGL